MTMPTPVIRPLTVADLDRVIEVYNHAVRCTDATLDTDEKSVEEMAAWLDRHGGRYPAVGAEVNGVLAGYGTLSPFAARGGYLASAEASVYVAPDSQGRGVGAALCGWLTDHAEHSGLSTVVALISSTNSASLRMVARIGYQNNGVLSHIGYKLGHFVSLEVHQRVFADNVRNRVGSAPAELVAKELTP